MNETPYQIAMLAATIAHGRDPLQHINDAWDLLRACAAPALPPVEAPTEMLTYEEATVKIHPIRDEGERLKALFEFFTSEHLAWNMKNANCQPGGYAWESAPREATEAEALASMKPVRAYIESLKAEGLTTNQVANLAARFALWKKERVSAERVAAGKKGGDQTNLKKQKRKKKKR